ncbi:MAG TPA: hypothetical protein PLD25_30210 [Chloroflexota bacterium]|nr:hypothetical protein [Chloroflexota bacterium]HUM68110.1 hypothetical protein [Chloroflexota bacterium]
MLKAHPEIADVTSHQQPALSGPTMLGLSKWPLLPPPHAPETLWPIALGELKQQMTKATFNAWLVDSRVIPEASSPAFLVISVRNQYAYEWLTYRLQPVIVRTLTGMAGYEVVVCFIPRVCRTMRKSYDESARRPSTTIPCPIRR